MDKHKLILKLLQVETLVVMENPNWYEVYEAIEEIIRSLKINEEIKDF